MPDAATPKKRKRADRTASIAHENRYFKEGIQRIMGLDEAGRGPLAGPVVAGAVALPLSEDNSKLQTRLKGVKDSKDMTPTQRESVADTIKEVAVTWGIGHASPDEIASLNIRRATQLAMQRAFADALQRNPDYEPQWLFVDYEPLPGIDVNQLSMPKADKYSLSVAAASVIAKIWRDIYMVQMAEEYPQYGFETHKGYGTTAHLAAIEEHGPCALHRLSFAPIQKALKKRHR